MKKIFLTTCVLLRSFSPVCYCTSILDSSRSVHEFYNNLRFAISYEIERGLGSTMQVRAQEDIKALGHVVKPIMSLNDLIACIEADGDSLESDIQEESIHDIEYYKKNFKPKISREQLQDIMRNFVNVKKHFYGVDIGRWCGVKMILKEPTKIVVCGDLHSSVFSLIRNIQRLIEMGILFDSGILEDNYMMVFTGDYVDRGDHGIEVLALLMALAIINPERVFLLRGNHEDDVYFFDSMKDIPLLEYMKDCSRGSFLFEVFAKYGELPCFPGTSIADKINGIFNLLIPVLYIGDGDNFIQFCHGGLPNKANIRVINELLNDTTKYNDGIEITKDFSLLWSDFCLGYKIFDGLRGTIAPGYTFGIDSFHRFLPKVKNIVRGHQHNTFSVSVLMHDDGAFWAGLVNQEAIPLSEFPVYTCMSCPEAKDMNPDVLPSADGFAVIDIVPQNYAAWTITSFSWPLQQPPEQVSRCVIL